MAAGVSGWKRGGFMQAKAGRGFSKAWEGAQWRLKQGGGSVSLERRFNGN